MTGAEFYAYCKRIFKRTDKETEFYEIVTDVIMDIKLRYEYEDYKSESTITGISSLGDYKLTLPTNFQHLIGDVIWRDSYSHSHPLDKISKAQFDVLYPNPTATDYVTGVPRHYCLYANEILIGPIPDQTDYTYSMNYTTEAATTITSATASVPFTDDYRWVLRDLVLGEFYSYIEQYDLANHYRTRGEVGLIKTIAKEDNNVDAQAMVAFNDI